MGFVICARGHQAVCVSPAETCLPRIGLHLLLPADTVDIVLKAGQCPLNSIQTCPFDWVPLWWHVSFYWEYLLSIAPSPHLSPCWQIGVPAMATTPSPALTPPGFLYIISFCQGITHTAVQLETIIHLPWTLNSELRSICHLHSIDKLHIKLIELAPHCVNSLTSVCGDHLVEQCGGNRSPTANHMLPRP